MTIFKIMMQSLRFIKNLNQQDTNFAFPKEVTRKLLNLDITQLRFENESYISNRYSLTKLTFTVNNRKSRYNLSLSHVLSKRDPYPYQCQIAYFKISYPSEHSMEVYTEIENEQKFKNMKRLIDSIRISEVASHIFSVSRLDSWGILLEELKLDLI